MNFQAGIIDGLPTVARFLSFQLIAGEDPTDALGRLPDLVDGTTTVAGIGPATLGRIDASIPGLHEPPCLEGKGVSIPATPAALWLWLRGSDRGELIHRARGLEAALDDSFQLDAVTDSFVYEEGRDLSGYVDGTENPTGAAANKAALVSGSGPGMDGSSFVAVQEWVHDLAGFESFEPKQRDEIIGRRIKDNSEIEHAPKSAHVKRTAQEDFDPEAFVLRRSMPWCDRTAEGLMFVAFGHSFNAFEALLRRMVGLDDGVVDGLFRFTEPTTTSYFWCPPMTGTGLDLRALNL